MPGAAIWYPWHRMVRYENNEPSNIFFTNATLACGGTVDVSNNVNNFTIIYRYRTTVIIPTSNDID